jgi:hypothetical protein
MEFPILYGPSNHELQVARLAEMKKQELLAKRLFDKASSLVGSKQGQCVIAVRSFLKVGHKTISGYAGNLRTSKKTASVGDIIKFTYGHVGVVLKVDNNNITYYHSNGHYDEMARIDVVPLNSSIIAGYLGVDSPIF